MGWGRTLILGDIGNRLDIADTENEIRRLKRSLSVGLGKDMAQDNKIDRLEQENAELKLYLASVVRLLLSKGVVSAGELEAMVELIDGADGAVDGKKSGSVI
jgi:hypothetical protein